MKSIMVTVLIGLACLSGTAAAEDAPFGPGGATGVAVKGAAGVPAPTPYPQLTVPPPPGDGGITRDSSLLPAIKTPSPPKEPDSGGFESSENKARAPNS